MSAAFMTTMVPPSPILGFVHPQSQGNWVCVYDSRRRLLPPQDLLYRRIVTPLERKRSVLLLATTLAPETVEARMPAWKDIPLCGVLDRLEEELTRKPFSDEAWETSADLLTTVCVELAGYIVPFSDEPCLPMPHAAAISFVDRLNERCRRADVGEAQKAGVPIGLHSSLKFSIKRNGVARVMADVGERFSPTFGSSRERLVAVRGVERCLAEFCVVWSTARLLEACAPPETKRDFVFYLKALLEHAPARDRLAAVLVLCRGLFTPGHNDAASRIHDNVHGVALRPHAGGSSLVDSFAQVQKQTANNPAGLRAARQAFPFLEMLARWAWRCHTPEPIKSTPRTKAFGKKKKEKESNGSRKNAFEATNTAVPKHRDNAKEVLSESRKEGGVLEEGKACRRLRGREDTGVASLLATIAEADPSGETIRCLQRWACDAVLLEEVSESSQFDVFDGAIRRNEVARAVVSTHETFVSGRKSNRQRWMRACREVGEIVRLLVLANDDSCVGELETDVNGMVNHAMFVTTFLRSMPQGVAARKGYEQVVAAGHVPGDTKGMATSAALPRAKTWKEAVGVLDSGIASVLGVHEDMVRSDAYRRSLFALMTSWESPYALADYYVMHRKHREVAREYLRFLRAVLEVSSETVRDIRINDPCNQEHMRHFPESVRRLWEAEPSTLPGTTDPRIIFRMGEDTRSCMGIRRSCKSQNRALLGYLLQGNVRLVGLQSPSGRMEARAVIRLLLRSDNMTPALLMDSVYYSSNPDLMLEQQVLAEAQGVSDALGGVPLFRAGDKVPVDSSLPNPKPEGSLKKEDCHDTSMCALVEMDGLSTWVYSDGAVGTVRNPGLLHRDSYPGASRKVVLAELEYHDDQYQIKFDDGDVGVLCRYVRQ